MKQNRITHAGSVGRFFLALILLGAFQVSMAQEFVWAPDFPVGASIPDISAQDQDGNLRTFDELTVERRLPVMSRPAFD